MRLIKVYKTEHKKLVNLKNEDKSKLINLDSWKAKLFYRQLGSPNQTKNKLNILVSPYIVSLFPTKSPLTRKVRFATRRSKIRSLSHTLDTILVETRSPNSISTELTEDTIFNLLGENKTDCIKLLKYLKKIPDMTLSPLSLAFLKKKYYRCFISTWFLKRAKPEDCLIDLICHHISQFPKNRSLFNQLNIEHQLCCSIFSHFYNIEVSSRYRLKSIKQNQRRLPVLYECMSFVLKNQCLTCKQIAIVKQLLHTSQIKGIAESWQLDTIEKLFKLDSTSVGQLMIDELCLENICLLKKLSFFKRHEWLHIIIDNRKWRDQKNLIKALYDPISRQIDLYQDVVLLLNQVDFPTNLKLIFVLNQFSIACQDLTAFITEKSTDEVFHLAQKFPKSIARTAWLIPEQTDYCFLTYLIFGHKNKAENFLRYGYPINLEPLIKSCKTQAFTNWQIINCLEVLEYLYAHNRLSHAMYEHLWYIFKQQSVVAEVEIIGNPDDRMPVEHCCVVLLERLSIEPAKPKLPLSHQAFHPSREKQLIEQFITLINAVDKEAYSLLLLKAGYDKAIYTALYHLYSHQVLPKAVQVICHNILEQTAYCKETDKVSYHSIFSLKQQINQQQQTIEKLQRQLNLYLKERPCPKRLSI